MSRADGRTRSAPSAGMPSIPCSTTSSATRGTCCGVRPDVLRALLTGLPDTWTTTPDVADGWRPRDVVGHLISAELDDWIPRTRRILEHRLAKPTRFQPSPTWSAASCRLDSLIDQFSGLRADNLVTVDALATDDNLDRKGLHPSLGAVTLRELLATWAVHDLDHVSQIYAGLAGAYDAEVGPWRGVPRHPAPSRRRVVPGEPEAGSRSPSQSRLEAGQAGVCQSSDARFSIRSEGPSRWFITDEQQQDELGLARTVGPFDTLDAAKAGADALRDEAPAASPLAGRLAREGGPATREQARQGEASGPRAEAATPTDLD